MKTISKILFCLFVFMGNIIPIAGPSLVSFMLGLLEDSWRRPLKKNRASLISLILIGNLSFALLAVALLDVFKISAYFQQNIYGLIAGIMALNVTFSIALYFAGVAEYKRGGDSM